MVLKGGKIAVTVDADGIHIDAQKGAEGVVTVEVIAGKERQTKTLELKEAAKDSRLQSSEQLSSRVSLDDAEVRYSWRSR